ncbi:hypothetical protein BAE44_0018906 [Dichanthelium oligosanthes]|uniref:Uncharacterized protein n=1 Tax=Dichanthelium oligosanthes TaxID=888268 RepID=A0A1E5V4W1_9POAL|nr:hypothetical protein BAE44_0018906 [Dichanthelium oligosanthes]
MHGEEEWPDRDQCKSQHGPAAVSGTSGIVRGPAVSFPCIILRAEIPPEIGNCTPLVRFRASGNHLAGAIPPEVGKLVNLRFLDLSSVRRHPRRDRRLPEPHYLDLSYNSIGGAIPSDIAKFGSLTKLVLGGNRLTGQVPPEIDRLVFTAPAPGPRRQHAVGRDTGKIRGLEIALDLSCNGLSGLWCHTQGVRWARAAQRARRLDVSHNQLSGERRSPDAVRAPEPGGAQQVNISFNNFAGRAVLREADHERRGGQPGAVPLSRCTGDASDRERAARRAAVPLSALVALLAAAAFLLIGRRRDAAAVGRDAVACTRSWRSACATWRAA